MDITTHPLADFFRHVAAEYDRGLLKYGEWDQYTDDVQRGAVEGEFHEWARAESLGYIHGPHGCLEELPQLANVAGRRWLQLKGR